MKGLFHPGGGLPLAPELLRPQKIRLADQRGMQPIVELIIFRAPDALFHHAVLDAFDLAAPSSANLAHVDRVGQDLADRGVAPQAPMARGDGQIVQGIGDLLGARPAQKQFKHLFHRLRFLRMRLQGIPLFTRQFDPAVAIGRDAGDVFALRGRAVPSANQPAGDRLILPPAHEQPNSKYSSSNSSLGS